MDGNFVLEIEDFISEELCSEIIQKFENEPEKRKSTISTPVQGNIIDIKWRDSVEVCFPWMKGIDDIYNEVNYKFKKAIELYIIEFCNYFKKYGENPKIIKSKVLRERNFQMRESGWTVQRVTAQTEFGWHSDEGEQYGHTFILYLNDIDIEDGGATEFAYGRKVQPKAGKLLIFPGGWSNVHRGCFVRKPKYMITNNSNFYYPRRFPFITS
jgi:hypothetical protein